MSVPTAPQDSICHPPDHFSRNSATAGVLLQSWDSPLESQLPKKMRCYIDPRKVQQWAASHCFCLTHTQQGAVPGSAVTQLTPEASNWLHLSRQSFPSSSASEVDNRCLWGPGMQRKWMKFRRARPPVNWRSFAPSKEGRCYSTLANCHQIWKSLSF